MEKKDNVHSLHRKRVKERFLKNGFDSFDSHEILELLLFFAIPQRDTNELGHSLISTFGSLSGVFDAPIEELSKIPGLSEHSALLLKLIPSLSRAYMTEATNRVTLSNYDEAGKYFVSRYIGVTVECVMLALLDNKNRVIDCMTISEGSVNSSDVSIRKIAETALSKNASSIILAHNHPGGIALPSGNDLTTTKVLLKALELLDIRFTEHFIIAGESYLGILSKESCRVMRQDEQVRQW